MKSEYIITYKEDLKTNYQQVNVSKKILFFLILFFLGLMSASVTYAENYTYVTSWGSIGSGDGQFDCPCGVAIDSSGNVYVADTYNNRIQKFSSDGAFLTKWGAYGRDYGQFLTLQAVAFDSFGDVYVADYANSRIQKFDGSGNFITSWGSQGSLNGQFFYPEDIAFDSSDNFYVADSNHRIQKFSSNGTFLTKWGSRGSGDGQFNFPTGIAVDSSGNVYVAESSNHRIQKFSSDGTFLTKWGSRGSGDGQFSYPNGVAIDSSDNVYVADTVNNRIQKFSNDGTFLTKLGSYGSDNGQFYYPQDIAFDSFGNLYVADAGNYRIQKFNTKITPTIAWNNPADIIYGTPLSNTQLNAISSVPGTFVYTPAEGAVLSAGQQQILHVDFTPTDTVNYNTASKDVTINVNKADPIITWSNPADIRYKTALSSTQLNAVASVSGTFIYTPASGTILSVGTQTLKVDFTPTDTANYNSESQTAIINVGKNKNGDNQNDDNQNE